MTSASTAGLSGELMRQRAPIGAGHPSTCKLSPVRRTSRPQICVALAVRTRLARKASSSNQRRGDKPGDRFNAHLVIAQVRFSTSRPDATRQSHRRATFRYLSGTRLV